MNKKIKIYMASGWFNEVEEETLKKVREILDKKENLEVFYPSDNQFKELEFGSIEWRRIVFNNDINGILSSDIVLAILNEGNNGSDMGTVWETGFAYSKGIPVVVFNDRGLPINLMVSDSLHAYIDTYEKLENYDFDKLEKIEYTDYIF